MIHLNNLPDPSNTKHEVIQLKKTRILAVSLAAVFCAAGAGLLFLRPQSAVPTLPIPEPISKKQIYSTPNIDASQENSEIPATAEVNPQFVIREYQGHIGVFRNGNEYPFEAVSYTHLDVSKRQNQIPIQGLHWLREFEYVSYQIKPPS